MQEIVSRVVNLPEILRLLISAAVALPTNEICSRSLDWLWASRKIGGFDSKNDGDLRPLNRKQ